jgi:hypothetical protein
VLKSRARKDGGSPNPGISINNRKARNDNKLHLDKHYISNNFQVPFLPDILLERYPVAHIVCKLIYILGDLNHLQHRMVPKLHDITFHDTQFA